MSGCRCPPGAGLADQSLDFWRDPVEFFRRRRDQHKSAVFNARFLLKTTTFLGCSRAVNQVLSEKSSCFQLGYKEYLSGIYGDVVLFAEEEAATELRGLLCQLFCRDSVNQMKSKISSYVCSYFDAFSAALSEPICIYSSFKRLSSELMISLFLDLNPLDDKDTIEQVIDLSVTHWHGIISVPVSLKGLGFSSGYRKAMDAKDKLLELVKKRWAETAGEQDGFLGGLRAATGGDERLAWDHLVLLVTALVPKAMASLLTSVILSSDHWKTDCLDLNGNLAEEVLECILREVARLWPPFIAGRRVAKQNVEVAGFTIPAGRPVMFLAHAAHRDPSVFSDPESFDWQRWMGKNKEDEDKLLWFGAGSRSCIGKHFTLFVLKEILLQFFHRFDWELPEKKQLGNYKWLPVSRPKEKPKIRLHRRQQPSFHA